MATAPPSTLGESLYETLVWPALWDVLCLSPADAPQRRSRALQHAITRALVRLLNTAAPIAPSAAAAAAVSEKVQLNTLEAVSSQLLLHTHGATHFVQPHDPTAENQRGILGPATVSLFTPAAAAAAVEVERLLVLVCTAIQLRAQTDVVQLSGDRVSAVVAGAAAASTSNTATAAPAAAVVVAVAPPPAQLPAAAVVASKAIVSGIFGLARLVTGAANVESAEQRIQPLWFTFLFLYLQQVSAHTPKDTAPYARFFESCAREQTTHSVLDPISSDDDSSVVEEGADTRSSVSGKSAETTASEKAALRAWSQVSPDLLKDTIARTRFRRAALLFKSFTPHMTTQAPTLVFLLSDLLCEYSRCWATLMRSLPVGSLDDALAGELTRYSTRSITQKSTSWRQQQQRPEQWQRCCDLIASYGERLSLLLGEGMPHAHLVATTLCAVLSSLYILPHTRPTGVSAADVSALYPTSATATATTSSSSPLAPGVGKAGAAGSPVGATTGAAAAAAAEPVGRGRRDEEAAVQELEAGYRLPRRATFSAAVATETATTTASSTTVMPGAALDDDARMSEPEWQLRHYAPFGQLLAHVHILELQKVHLFSVGATEMRVGRTAAQQVEHVRLLALTTLYCGVAGWDLALLLYHYAQCPLSPFTGAETSPAPSLPTAVLSRYTAAARQYVEQSRAELIVTTPFQEFGMNSFRGGGGGGLGMGDRRRGGGGGMMRGGPPVASVTPTIPSRGELQTPRFNKMVCPDPLLLSWDAHVAAVEMARVAATAPQSNSLAAGTSSPPASPSPPGASVQSLAASPAGSPDALLTPCCLVRDILVSGQYALATAGARYLAADPFGLQGSSGSTATSSAAALSLNVLLPPRRAFPGHISIVFYASVVLRRWLQRWETLRELLSPQQQQQREGGGSEVGVLRLRKEMVMVLQSLLPLLSTVQCFVAHQALLTRLVSSLVWLCRATVTAARTASSSSSATTTTTTTPADAVDALTTFALVEKTVICVVMPCLRVLPPAVMVYDMLDDLTELFTNFSRPHAVHNSVVCYGDSPASPLHVMAWLEALLPTPSLIAVYRTQQQQQQWQATDAALLDLARLPPALLCPRDVLLRKEREAMLSHSLKRLNAENIEEYRAALRPILFAEPLLVAHRLFIQAVGYNNNFLNVHTHLLHGLPSTILMLILQQGLCLMARYAAEEKVTDPNGESRTALLATFLATLWRDNVGRLDGTVLVRRVELALRNNSGSEILIGTELCKALLAVMAYRTLEHTEKYSAAQLQALTTAPSTASFFGRGSMTSFRMRLWEDASCALLLLSPTDVFVRARRALTEALQQRAVVPLQPEDDPADEEEEGNGSHKSVESSLTLGQLIIVHFCRLLSRVYELQRDLDGKAELILLASAERFNAMNDMMVIVEEMTAAPTESVVLDRLCALVQQSALPQVAFYVVTQLRRKVVAQSTAVARTASLLAPADAVYRVPIATLIAAPSSSPSPSSSPVVRQLQWFTAAHFEFAAAPYEAARQEWQQCMRRAEVLLAAHNTAHLQRQQYQQQMMGMVAAGGVDRARAGRAAAIIAWLNIEKARMDAEEAAHKHLVQSAAPARAALFDALLSEIVPADAAGAAAAEDRLIDLAASYLLPRAVLNLREAATVAAFFTWAFQQAEAKDTAQPPQQQPQQQLTAVQRVTDLALTFVSAAFTYFVAFTDGECKRIGHVVQRLLEVSALSSAQQLLKGVGAASGELLTRLSPLLAAAKPRDATVGRVEGSANKLASTPANGDAARTGKGNGSSAGSHNARSAGSHSGAAADSADDVFSRVFLGLSNGSEERHGEALPQPSIVSLAVARGLVDAAAVTTAADTNATAKKVDEEAAEQKRVAAAAKQSATPATITTTTTTWAVPLQMEAYLCRALVQLLSHEADVPVYAQRNLLLILEQIDKSAFPATLCAADVLIRAMEPHASKTKSYYALASAVLKSLRASRRNLRDAQQAVVAMSRGEAAALSNAASSSLSSLRSATTPLTAATAGVSDALREAATAVYGQWRLREHYMKQLLQSEVTHLWSSGPGLGQHVEEEDETEEDEEADGEGDAAATQANGGDGNAAAGRGEEEDEDGEGRVEEGGDERPLSDSDADRSAAEDEERDSASVSGSERSDGSASDSAAYSGDDGEEGEEDEEGEGDGHSSDGSGGGDRKRAREE